MEPGVPERLAEFRKALIVCGVERLDLLAHVVERCAAREPADHLPVVAVASVIGFFGWRVCGRREEIDVVLEKRELARHHTDDVVRRTVQPDGAAHDRRTAAELSLPEAVAENGFEVLARLALVVVEQPPERWMHLHEPKERWRGSNADDALGAVLVPERDRLAPEQCLLVERAHIAKAIEVVWNRVADAWRARVRIAVVEEHDPRGALERQRLHQYGSDHAEHRRIGRDADGQREESGDGEAAVPDQQAQTEPEVLKDGGHQTSIRNRSR